MKRKRLGILFLCLILFLFGESLKAEASYESNPFITLSPDGSAFTTNAGDLDIEYYDRDYEVITGVQVDKKVPGVGEHYYANERSDMVPVSKWVVYHPLSRCMHNIYPSGSLFYGVTFGRKNCYQTYFSGWMPYCADCDELLVNCLYYMDEETAKNIDYLDMSKAYYYKCPHCDNLEQGYKPEKHICKGISPNRYFVRYHANLGSGTMEKSVHMVNNASSYEGQEVTPQTSLNLNAFSRIGYEFIGWNTKKDGSGESFDDGAEIYNLTTEENASVTLYAQWKKSQSILEIDPAGGSYQGKTGVTQISGDYGSRCTVDSTKLIAPKGYTVHFNTKGGEHIEDTSGVKSFLEWSRKQPFKGEMQGEEYTFGGSDGAIDRITAVYTDEAILLPEPVREGYSFGGWFTDEECTQPVGGAGSSYVPTKEVTLYAAWVDLVLNAVNNNTANQGKGAVNLSWSQKDNQNKVYRLYQRREDTDWEQISSAEDKVSTYQVSDTILYTGESNTYKVIYSGIYTLTLSGAQGGNYGDYLGGKGGKVQAVVYLEQGDELEYTIGGQNGFNGGGLGKTYGRGGGYSILSFKDGEVLLIAGGGGGATSEGNGGEGGSSASVTEAAKGQDGEAGGGGGYQGGIAGAVAKHLHQDTCKHTHSGNASTYGGCYTKEIICGGTEFKKEESDRRFYYGNIDDDGKSVFCVRCNSYECSGHLDITYTYTCNSCKVKYEKNMETCTTVIAYDLGCEENENYTCGMEEGQIISAKPAYGGSNYVNTDRCISYSEEAGSKLYDGSLLIQSSSLEVLDGNQLNGVAATDLAAPDAISMESVCKTAVSEDRLRISFERPEDNGTVYYHLARSFSTDNGKQISESKPTINTLSSGVVGYRYVLDSIENTTVKADHTLLSEKEEDPFLVVEPGDTITYLHIAAVDKADNLGPTIHIPISLQDVVYWPLITEKLILEEGNNVYPAGQEDMYYVRADGSTPFGITLEGLLCGTARKDYQINRSVYWIQDMTDTSLKGSMAILTPNRENITIGTYTYPMKQLQKLQEGTSGLQDASYTVTKRYNMCKNLSAIQKFSISSIYDSHLFQITPQVMAEGEKETICSDPENDSLNSIYVIADGKGPIISGMEKLQNLEYVDYSAGRKLEVDIQAVDEGCGLAEFYVEIYNLDNGGVVRYEDETLSGKIHLVISEANVIFNGEFTVMAYAADCVGNETSVQNNLLGVGLKAYVRRVLIPHTPVFKRGESGVLHIQTLGYIERVEVSFPDSFTQYDAGLNRTFVYDIPDYKQTEEISFMVPLSVSDGEAAIQVKAYKAGTELEKEPELITIKVEGSILDELRTRLR